MIDSLDGTMIGLAVAIYTGAIVAFGLWRSRAQSDNSEDYFLAGRSLGAWLAAFSGAASAESGWVLLGLVGTGYSGGISALWLVPGCLAGYLFNWFVLAPRLRARSKNLGAVTVPDVLANHAGTLEPWVRRVAGLIILLFMTAYVGAQFNAVGKALDAMFGMPYVWGVLVGVGIVFAYTISGGFRASVWTDLAQALLMVGALILLPIGGALFFDGSLSATLGQHETLFGWSAGKSGFAALGFIIGWLGIGLAYPGQPQVLARFMATKDDTELRRAGKIAAVWSTLVFVGAILTGLVARAWLPGLSDPEQALPSFAMHFLPAPVAGLVLAAVLAAICSTADSQLLVASSAVGHDLSRLGHGTGSRRRNQVVLVVLGSASAAFAATENRAIFDFVLYAWAALGASIGPALVGVLFWPRTSGKGLLAGLVGGVATVVIWKNIPSLSGTVYELVPGFFVSLVLVRFVAPKPGTTTPTTGAPPSGGTGG